VGKNERYPVPSVQARKFSSPVCGLNFLRSSNQITQFHQRGMLLVRQQLSEPDDVDEQDVRDLCI
jgi:hypothetical protein